MFVLQASAFNVNYSDSGIFGFYTISQAAHTGEVSGWLEWGCWQPVPELHGDGAAEAARWASCISWAERSARCRCGRRGAALRAVLLSAGLRGSA